MNIDAALVRYVGASAPRGTVERDIVLPEGRFISAIIGPRRAGKTTFMLQVMDAMPLPASNKILVNGEDVNLEGVATDDLGKIEEAAFRIYRPDRTKEICLFIDEVQSLPSWPRWVRTLYDSGTYRIVVTGSTSELSTVKLPSAFRGRALNTLVLPFSFQEFLRSKGSDYSRYMPPGKTGEIASLADEFIEYGGYPAVVLSEGRDLKLRVSARALRDRDPARHDRAGEGEKERPPEDVHERRPRLGMSTPLRELHRAMARFGGPSRWASRRPSTTSTTRRASS